MSAVSVCVCPIVYIGSVCNVSYAMSAMSTVSIRYVLEVLSAMPAIFAISVCVCAIRGYVSNV